MGKVIKEFPQAPTIVSIAYMPGEMKLKFDEEVPQSYEAGQQVALVEPAYAFGLPSLFQSRVRPWMLECFGAAIAADNMERNHRFLEESLELVQACGCSASEAHQLVDYVFNRPVGEKPQEVGGVMVTLAALCIAQNMDMHVCGEVELIRIWNHVDAIRKKQASKPAHSPLPAADVSANDAEYFRFFIGTLLADFGGVPLTPQQIVLRDSMNERGPLTIDVVRERCASAMKA